MPREQPRDLTAHILRPTPDEVRNTHILFHAEHAIDTSEARRKVYGYVVEYHASILRALRGMGFRVTPESDVAAILGPLDYDYIYSSNASTAFEGHELMAPAVVAFRGLPYLGSSAPIRALAEDKVLGKHVAASLGIEVAEHRILNPLAPGMADFSLPGRWILKPRGGSFSNAVSVVDDPQSWRRAMTAAADPRHEGREFMAEAFVPGVNLTVPVVEGFPPRSFEVFEERGREGDNVITEEAKIGLSPEYAHRVYEGPGYDKALDATEKLAAAMAPLDYGRFDFRYDPENDRLVFLEVNIVCAMGPASVVSIAAKHCGVDHPSLVGHILTYSLRRQRMQL